MISMRIMLDHPLVNAVIRFDGERILGVSLSGDHDDRISEGVPEFVRETVLKMERLLDGEMVEFDLSRVDLSVCTPYQLRVLRVVSGIPWGSTMSYGELAEAAGGSPRSAGSALAANPFPIIIPCHRVIRSDGSPGGYQGGTELKRILLKKEGAL
ncbi:methylated-DNA-[protein]-cysteine S-methyltransferase [Methanothermobacter sp. DSM 3267]